MPTTAASAVRSPSSIDELTPAWATGVLLVDFPDVAVLSCIVEEQIWGTVGKIRVRMRYNEAGRLAELPETMIVKAGFGRNSVKFERLNHHPEIFAYQKIVPQLGINAPRIYHASIDDGGRLLILMEDLDALNVRFCRITSPLNFKEAAAFLDLFAQVNARWWDNPELKTGGSLNFLPETLELSEGAGVWNWVEMCLEPRQWAQVNARPRAYAVPRSYRNRVLIERAMVRLQEIWRLQPKCVVHGDEHLNNLFIEPDGRAGLFDWQTKKAPWVEGFSYFLVGAPDLEDRRHWEKPLLEYYLKQLAAHGGPHLDFDTAWLSYRLAILFGPFIFLTTLTSMQPEEVCVANAARFGAAALDHDTFGALGV